jgi:hypothetical protein
LDKLADRVDIQKNSIAEQTRGCKVAGPHLKLNFRDIFLEVFLSFLDNNVFLIFLDEVLWEPADLLVVLRRQRGFHQDVKEVQYLGHILPLCIRHHVQTEVLLTGEPQIALNSLRC